MLSILLVHVSFKTIDKEQTKNVRTIFYGGLRVDPRLPVSLFRREAQLGLTYKSCFTIGERHRLSKTRTPTTIRLRRRLLCLSSSYIYTLQVDLSESRLSERRGLRVDRKLRAVSA